MAGEGSTDAAWPPGQVCFPIGAMVMAELTRLLPGGEADPVLADRVKAEVIAGLTERFPGMVDELIRDAVQPVGAPAALPPRANFGSALVPAGLPGSADPGGQATSAADSRQDVSAWGLPQKTAEPDADYLSESDLAEVADTVVRSVRGRSPGGVEARQGPGRSAADCLILLEGLARALYPRGEGSLPGGVRPAATADDLILGTAGPEQKLAPGADWRRVTSWASLAEAVDAAGPGATGLVLLRRRTGLGHAFAVHNVRGTGVRWVELQESPDHRVTVDAPRYSAADARVVVVDGAGHVVSGPSVTESSIPGLAVADPAASREYGAVGDEWEAANISLIVDAGTGREIPKHEIPRHRDVLFSNSYVSGLVEGGGELFLEFVGTPNDEVEGDKGYADRQGLLRSVDTVVKALGQSSRVPISSLSHYGFTIHEKAKHVSMQYLGGGMIFGVQISAGVESGGQYDLLQWALENRPGGVPVVRHDITTALTLADEIAYRYARSLIGQSSSRIPTIEGLLRYGDDVYSMKGYIASVVAHAIAPLRVAQAQISEIEGYRAHHTAKQFIAVASRHPVRIVREALPPTAQQFLDGYAADLKKRFTEYAAKMGLQSIDDPLRIPIGNFTVDHYLDDAFLNGNVESSILQSSFGIYTSLAQLDRGLTVARKRPLNVNELRDLGIAGSLEEAYAKHEEVASAVRDIFDRMEHRRTRSRFFHHLQDPESTFARLARDPVAMDVEVLLEGIDSLNFLIPGRFESGLRVELNWDLFLDWVTAIARQTRRATDEERTDDLVTELRWVLSQLDSLGKHALERYMENPDSEELLGVLLRWARAVRVAGRLLLAANPLADTRIPKEKYLTEWSSISEVPGLFGVRRSAGIRLIDESVKQLLESPEDPRRLLRVLASIRSWRLTKPDFNASKRADAVRGLEQRVIYEMGASWAGSPAADARGSGSAAHSPEFLHALTSEVNAWLHSGQLAWNRQPGAAANPATLKEVRGIYLSLAPADRSHGTTREMAYEIALQIPRSRAQAQRLRGGAGPVTFGSVWRAVTSRAEDASARDTEEPAGQVPAPAARGQQAADHAESAEGHPAAAVPAADRAGVPEESFSVHLSAASSENKRLTRFAELRIEAALDTGAMASQIAGAFREHFDISSGQLPDDFDVQVDVPEGFSQQIVFTVLLAASKATEELGRYINVKPYNWPNPAKLCPPSS